MLRNSEGPAQRRRGRPPKDATDALRTCAWFYAVQSRSGNASAYALEKQFFATCKNSEGSRISTGNWRQYRYGRRVPNEELVSRVEQLYPKTRVLLELPFWELIRVPAPSFERVHVLMSSLRSDITELLFYPSSIHGPRLERFRLKEPYGALDRMSDIEALSAAIGLIREAEYEDNEYQHYQSAVIALRIFRRLATFTPWTVIGPVLLEYLRTYFLAREYEDFPIRGPAFLAIDLECAAEIRRSMLSKLDDLEVLPFNYAMHRACLYLIDVYGIRKAAFEVDELHRNADWKTVKSAHVVKWFTRRLRSFKLTQSCLD